MKFTDGYWRNRAGVTKLHAVGLRDAVTDGGTLTLYAATRAIHGRGDTLDHPLITIRLSSPMPDVIRVDLSHFHGGVPARPAFELAAEPGWHGTSDATAATFTSGCLTARFGAAGLEFVAGGRVLTRSGRKGIGVVDTADGARFVHEQLSLGVGEHVYGLGERFGPFVKNGQVVDCWNGDGGTSSEQAYKNIPFYLSDNGYGVLVDHPGGVSFEVGSETVSRVQFSVPGEELSYLVIHGPDPKAVLRRYTALTGRPPLVPPWSFGLWLSTSFTTAYDEATVTGFLDGMAGRDLPMSVFHFDCFWMREFHWCDFEWDPAVFPDPVGMLRRLRERGLRVSVWINPYVAQRSRLFAEGVAGGYLLKRADGSIWQADWWQAGLALVDFTNPAARAWFAGHLRALVDQGVDCFKTDFGERVPTDVAWFDGGDPDRMHNYYAFLYNQTVFSVLAEHHGPAAALVFARAATVGGQQFPVHWGGDCESSYEAMAETLRGGLSAALCGFGFWSHDIGGFDGQPDPALFKRWLAFGLLSSHSRLHGNHSYRVPWAFDDEAVAVLRTFTKLKLSLMPYLYAAAVLAHREGIPVLRPMVLEFPDDPACSYLDRQYLLGGDLLVAPVFRADGLVSYYVPAGRWTPLRGGAVVTGPAWVRQECGIDDLPLLVRPGAVLPVGARDDRPDYDYHDGVTLAAYELVDGATVLVTVPDQAGGVAVTFEVRRDGSTVRVRRDGPAAPWRLLLVGMPAVVGDGWTATERGALIEGPAADGCEIRLAD